MSHRDAEITEIVVVIHATYTGRLGEAVEKLKSVSMDVFTTDEDEGIVSGSIESYKLQTLQQLDCVNYVRSVLTYIADFPVGDPRDKDLSEDDEDAAEAV